MGNGGVDKQKRLLRETPLVVALRLPLACDSAFPIRNIPH
jgi:hypothetical protein